MPLQLLSVYPDYLRYCILHIFESVWTISYTSQFITGISKQNQTIFTVSGPLHTIKFHFAISVYFQTRVVKLMWAALSGSMHGSGPRIQYWCFWVRDAGSRVFYPESRFQDPGSRNLETFQSISNSGPSRSPQITREDCLRMQLSL